MLMPIHRYEGGRASQGIGNVLAANDAHASAPANDEAHERYGDRRRNPIEPQTALGQSPARARLLIVNGVT